MLPPAAKKRKVAPKPAQKSADAKGIQDIEDLPLFPSEAVTKVQNSLLAWYDANHRALPWRRNPHSKASHASNDSHNALMKLPQQAFIYRVWISEVMCQQTQVARASQYFIRWIAKWPTVSDLATATLDQVNELWAGLGYYRRAKYLHDGAKHVEGQLGGTFPTTSKELQKIPGIGAYTGAAISSIACGRQDAVVDANVVRVISRLLRLGGDPTSKQAQATVSAASSQLLHPQRPGCFNQAVMELGAVVCTQQPDCASCPIQSACGAYSRVAEHLAAGGLAADAPPVTQYPPKVVKKARKQQLVAVCVLRHDMPRQQHKYLLVKRAEKGLLAGLWEFPSVMSSSDDTIADGKALQARGPPANGSTRGSKQCGAEGNDRAASASKMTAEGCATPQGGNAGVARGADNQQQHQQARGRLQSSRKGRREAAREYIKEDLGLAVGSRAMHRQEIGSVDHTFSHIQMKLEVEMMTLHECPPPQKGGKGAETKWVTDAELAAAGLSSVMRKVADLVAAPHTTKSKQQTLAAFVK